MTNRETADRPTSVLSIHAVSLPNARTSQVIEAALAAGLGLRQYGTLESLIDSASSAAVGCVLLFAAGDATPTVTVVSQLKTYFQSMPIVVLHDAAQESTIVSLMQAGAFSVLGRTFSHEQLVDTMSAAADMSLRSHSTVDEARDASARMQQATDKELKVLDLIMAGKKNKEISAALGITVRAVEDRRFRLMKKVNVDSVAELVTTAVQARYYEEGFVGGGLYSRLTGPVACLKGIEVWTPHADGDHLYLSQGVYRDATVFGEVSGDMTFQPGEGLPGRVWESGAPVFFRDLITTEFVRTQVASAVGMTTAMGFPVFHSGRVQSIILLLLDTRYRMTAAFESWKYDSPTRTLKLAGGTWINCERLRTLTEYLAFPVGKGLPGKAAETHLPCAAAGFAEETTEVRGVALAAERLMSGVALPLTDSGREVDDVFLLFNSETSPLFSLQQVWKPVAGNLTLASEYVAGIPSLNAQMQTTAALQIGSIAVEAWRTERPVAVNLGENDTLTIPSRHTGSGPTIGIAIPTIVGGRVAAVTVLAD